MSTDQWVELPPLGSPSWRDPVANAGLLPASNNVNGDVRIALDTDTLYVWDGISWIAVATPGAAIALDGLIGDVSATGPGVAVATVNSVGGQTAAQISTSVILTQAATSSNTPNTLVLRNGSGDFSAGVVTANLVGNVTGNVSGSSSSFTGSLSGDVTGTQSATSISSIVVTSKLLTGYTTGVNTPIIATDSILVAFQNLQAQITAETGAAITALIGDGTATGPGAVTFTLTTVNPDVGSFGSSTVVPSFTVNGKGLITAAANIPIVFPITAVTGSGNIASSGGSTPNITFTGILPSSSGGTGVNNSFNLTIGGTSSINGTFSGSSSGTNTGDQTITLTGDVTGSGTGSFATTLATVNGNVGSFGSSTSIPSFTVNAKGLITAASANVVIAPAGTLTGATLAANVVNSSLTSVGTLTSLIVSGTISASNFSGSSSGTNTGDVTIGTANGLSLLGQVLSLGLSSTSTTGALSSTDFNTFNNKQPTITIGALDAQPANANGLALVSNVLSTQSADTTHPGLVNNTTQSFSGNKTFTGTISASNLSGTNTGDVTLAAVGSSPNANAASLSGQVLNLQPANASFPGVVTTGTQTFAGNKTLTGNTISANLTINGTAGAGFIQYNSQSVAPTTPVGGFILYGDSTNRMTQLNTSGFNTTYDSNGITASRVYTLRDVSGKINMDSRMSYAASTISSATTTIASTDAFAMYLVDTTAARTINLPTAASVSDRVYIFKDITGTAETFNISIVPNGTDQIEGLNSTKIIQTNFGTLTLVSDTVSKWWLA